MDAWWVTLLRDQQSDGFPDLTGADASITLPISDRLITRVVSGRIPPNLPVRDFTLIAAPGNTFTVAIRLTKPAFLPPIRMQLAIEQQPRLPESPFIVLAITSHGVATLAASALRYVDILPPGVRFERQRFIVDLAELLAAQGARDALKYLTELNITTDDHRVKVLARLAVPQPPASS